MSTLIRTVGLPRSGKSTWAKTTGFPIVNPDAIRLALHGRAFFEMAEPLVWAIAKIMVHALFLAGHETVILDATNTTKKRRDEWDLKGISTQDKIFDTLPKECVRRALAGGREDLVPVIQRMAQQWDLPVNPEVWFEGLTS